MFKQLEPNQFLNVVTGQTVTPEQWQIDLNVGDFYKIDNTLASMVPVDGCRGQGVPIVVASGPTVYGQIIDPITPGYFWVRAYSKWSPEGELGSVCICDPTAQLTPEQFEAAREAGWPDA